MILTPTISQLPLVGGVQLMFLSSPEVDFDFVGAARIASKLPAIKHKIKAELESSLSQDVVYPRRLVLPLSWSADPQMVWQGQVSGLLLARLVSVSGTVSPPLTLVLVPSRLCSDWLKSCYQTRKEI